MWYLATIVNGIDVNGLTTGRHCYVNRTPTGLVRIIAAGGLTALVRVDEARRRVRVERGRDGRPVAVRNQVKQEIRWSETREARRFDQKPGLAA